MSTSVHPAAHRVGPGVAVDVTEPMIHDLVHAFYAKVRADPALAPVFNRVIGDRWDIHLAKMCDFWSSVLLMTGRFKGSPMTVHAAIAQIRPTHFARWLHLFHQTAQARCPPAAAALFVAKSEMIAQSLQLGIAVSRGELPRVRPMEPANPNEGQNIAAGQ
ncbi:MAG: group III truncated hemoglobin [Caulobacteraceae bacterium]